VPEIAAFIRERRPQVMVTFDPFGAYGHPDHIAISQFTGAAIVAAADPSYPCDGPVHGVSKLYYFVSAKPAWDAYQAAFKQLTIKVDEVVRQASPWPDWSITTSIDTEAHWRTVWEAIRCHRTQLTIYEKLMTLPEEFHMSLWGRQEFYRVFSLVNSGRQREDDLFAGLR
jgi:LmbE family N-acetylglucosaminyl deacetylase